MLRSCDERFGEDYFERGRELGLSWYERYRWMPERSHAEARALLAALGADGRRVSVTDWGCAKGFLVRALVEQGHDARGFDVSRYALGCAPAACVGRVHPVDAAGALEPTEYGVCKDVLEHCRSVEELRDTLAAMRDAAGRWLLVVPLADAGVYRIPEYELDATHVIRENEQWWLTVLGLAGFDVRSWSYRVRGLKDHWHAAHPQGNLFAVATSTAGGP